MFFRQKDFHVFATFLVLASPQAKKRVLTDSRRGESSFDNATCLQWSADLLD